MIIYLHGLNSSPQSSKAQYLKRYLEERGLGECFSCPQLPHWPREAVAVIADEMARHATAPTLVGSSLGGFYATYLAEKHGVRAVLINPAIDPHVGLRAHLGPQRPYHEGGEPWELTEEHLQQWEALYVPQIHPERYLLLVETGDEVLDYRAAVKRYRGAQQIVVQGGDHSLASFPEHVPRILSFAGIGAG